MAADRSCQKVQTSLPELEIIDADNDIVFNFDLSKKEITQLQRMTGDGAKVSYNYSDLLITGNNYGLTVGEFQYELFTIPKLVKVSESQDLYCLAINKIVLKFSYISTVYVAKEYPRNGCGFNIILDHEMEHHNVNVNNKTKYLDWLRNDLAAVGMAISQKYQAVSKRGTKKLFSQMQEELVDAVDAYISKMHVDIRQQNALLDSPDEYLKLTRAVRRCYKKQQEDLAINE